MEKARGMVKRIRNWEENKLESSAFHRNDNSF